MKVPCSAPVCLLSSAGREEEERGGREGERSDFTFLPLFSVCRCKETHVSTSLRARGQEGQKKKERKEEKEGKKKQGGIGIWRRRSWRVFFSETQKEVEKKRGGLLPGWPSEESSDSFFGLFGLTNQHTKAKRESLEWRVELLHTSCARLGCPPSQSLRRLHSCVVCFHLKNWTMRRLYFTDLYATRLTPLFLHYSPLIWLVKTRRRLCTYLLCVWKVWITWDGFLFFFNRGVWRVLFVAIIRTL